MNLWEMGSEGISLIQLFHLIFQLMDFVLVVIKNYASCQKGLFSIETLVANKVMLFPTQKFRMLRLVVQD
jgi:hypothetical protein